jgi:5-methylcytosine-specific restriction endonuclease McrA
MPWGSSEKKNAYQRIYYQKTKERFREACQRRNKAMWKSGASLKWRFSTAVAQAKRRGIVWDLPKEFYEKLIVRPCDYCNEPLHISGSGLDRIDCTKGYSLGNVVPCCTRCNRIKGTWFTAEETRVAIQAVLAYRVFGRTEGNVVSVGASPN